ncbi:MAG: ABC transporter substrate-binding protein [Thermomicrobiales bacterium]|nr:ABC transporter substrate-binding protein [Thermomicrobiales bacterium]
MQYHDDEMRLLGDLMRGRVSRRSLVKRGVALGLSTAALGTLVKAYDISAQGGEPSGEVVYALEQAPPNIAPFGGVSQAQAWGNEHIYDSLLAWDPDLNIIPALAEAWEAPDNMSYIFTLRQGVLFHNGNEMKAADVVYSIANAVAPPPPGVAIGQLARIAGAEAIDDYTVKVNLTEPDPAIPGVFAWSRYTSIVPDGIHDQINVLTEGIGTGPYKVVEYVQDDRIVYEANTDYWIEGVPCIANLTLKVLGDEQARVSNLRSGEIDGGILSADVVVTLEGDENLETQSGLYAAPRVVQLSTAKDVPWRIKQVRQAISKCIDRNLIISNVYAGEAELTGPIPPGYGEYPIPNDRLAELYTVDIEGAKALMAEVGMESGFSVELQSIATPRHTTLIAEIFKENLKAINIDVTVQPLEIGQFAENVGNGSYEWASTGRGMRGDPAHFVIDFRNGTPLNNTWFADGGNTGTPTASTFGPGWQSTAIDELYDAAYAELDPAKRVPMYRELQEMIIDEAPHIYTVQDKRFQVVNKRLTGMYVAYDLTNRPLRYACAVEG